MGSYPPIEAHGLVGDLRTCALVSREGTVDRCPFPGVESPSAFAGVPDAKRGGHFAVYSFWLVDALALSGRVGDAREMFRSVTGFTNRVGLLAEEVDPETGAHLGNFPQGFSHVGLVNSALYLAHATDSGESTTKPMGLRLGDGGSLGE